MFSQHLEQFFNMIGQGFWSGLCIVIACVPQWRIGLHAVIIFVLIFNAANVINVSRDTSHQLQRVKYMDASTAKIFIALSKLKEFLTNTWIAF